MLINDSEKRIWPGYIKPEKNELFSSWLIRLSFEHRIKSHTFSKFYFDGQPIWNRDIDKLFPNNITINILRHTNLSFNEIRQMFLESYRDIIFNNRDFNSYTPGILNLGIYHRKRKQYGLLCCPSCLAKDIVYYKKEWRLFFSIACYECRCLLIDRCPECEKPIAFHRLETESKKDILKKSLYQCWYCGYDLRKAINTIAEKSIIMQYQKYINNSIENQYNDITQYSFQYFSILHHLSIKLLSSSKRSDRIKEITEQYFNYSFEGKNKIHYDLDDRKIVLIHSYLILKNWPNNFYKIFSNSNVRCSGFSKDINMLPCWFDQALKKLH